MFSSFSSINVVFAEENAAVQTTFDKESNEFLVVANKPNESGEILEKTYRAIS